MPDHWMNLPFLIPFFGESFNLLPLLMMLVTALGAFFFQDQHLKGSLLKQQKRKLYLMAFAFFMLFYTFPAGMVLYWTISNSLQLIKVIFLRYQT
jgi:membrane protein insertase Oxa1/YidC/SpoIIIJ